MFPKFIQVSLYSGERIYGRGGDGVRGVWGEGCIFGMLIGFHIWRVYIRRGVLTGFYGIFTTLHVRGISHIFDRTACIYQTAT